MLLKNEISCEAAEVVPVYAQLSGAMAPGRTLEAIRRVVLRVCESRQISFDLDAKAMNRDRADGRRVVDAGPVWLWVGGGQPVAAVTGLRARADAEAAGREACGAVAVLERAPTAQYSEAAASPNGRSFSFVCRLRLPATASRTSAKGRKCQFDDLGSGRWLAGHVHEPSSRAKSRPTIGFCRKPSNGHAWPALWFSAALIRISIDAVLSPPP